jgi:phosphoribosylformylglycinamidine synthase
MAQLSAAIDGIAEACTALGTPVTGGNVSLYNETKGEGIYPTPVIGIVGLIDDVSKAVPSGFQREGDAICLLYAIPSDFDSRVPNRSASEWQQWGEDRKRNQLSQLGSSEYAKVLFGQLWGTVPPLDLEANRRRNEALSELANLRLLHSAADEGSGGIGVTIARCCLPNNVGADLAWMEEPAAPESVWLFAEGADLIVITCDPEDLRHINEICRKRGIGCHQIGMTIPDVIKQTDLSEPPMVWHLDELRNSFSSTLESQLAAEVVTA